jgi:hypothetical protein
VRLQIRDLGKDRGAVNDCNQVGSVRCGANACAIGAVLPRVMITREAISMATTTLLDDNRKQ